MNSAWHGQSSVLLAQITTWCFQTPSIHMLSLLLRACLMAVGFAARVLIWCRGLTDDCGLGGRYFDLVPWESLASMNHNFLLTERRRHYLKYCGGLTYFEVSTPRRLHPSLPNIGLTQSVSFHLNHSGNHSDATLANRVVRTAHGRFVCVLTNLSEWRKIFKLICHHDIKLVCVL